MNKLFYRDLRKMLLEARDRELKLTPALEKWQGRLIVTAGEDDPSLTAIPHFCSDDRPRVPQPNSDNEISGPTS